MWKPTPMWWFMKNSLCLYISMSSATPSPHVKSGVFLGQMKSIWRAMTSPSFDFQGDLHQQGGAIIAGPGTYIRLFTIKTTKYLCGSGKEFDSSQETVVWHIWLLFSLLYSHFTHTLVGLDTNYCLGCQKSTRSVLWLWKKTEKYTIFT